MTLLAAFLDIAADWRPIFPRARSCQRAVRQALGSLVCWGRRCLSRIIWTNGGQFRSWSAEYFLHSRCDWQPQQLFRPILQRALAYCPGRLVSVAIDDTRLPKTGHCIQPAFFQRDPLSPPLHVNLMLGLRFLQASLLVPTYRLAPVSTRGLRAPEHGSRRGWHNKVGLSICTQYRQTHIDKAAQLRINTKLVENVETPGSGLYPETGHPEPRFSGSFLGPRLRGERHGEWRERSGA